jgi:hypothetical protein
VFQCVFHTYRQKKWGSDPHFHGHIGPTSARKIEFLAQTRATVRVTHPRRFPPSIRRRLQLRGFWP